MSIRDLMENSDNKLIFNTTTKRNSKMINPAFTFMKKDSIFLNGSLLNKRKSEYNQNYKFQHFSSNIKDSKTPHNKKIISLTNYHNFNNKFLINGRISENDSKIYNLNSNLIRKKLVLITKKDSLTSEKERIERNKRSKSQTFSNNSALCLNEEIRPKNEPKTKEEEIKIETNREEKRRNTYNDKVHLKLISSNNLNERKHFKSFKLDRTLQSFDLQKSNLNDKTNESQYSNMTSRTNRTNRSNRTNRTNKTMIKRVSFTNTATKECDLFASLGLNVIKPLKYKRLNTKVNYHFPSLDKTKLSLTERSANLTNLHDSNTFLAPAKKHNKMKKINTVEQYQTFLPKKPLNLYGGFFKQNSTLNKFNRVSNFAKIFRKNTLNANNINANSNMISKKLLNKHQFTNQKNQFMKNLTKSLKKNDKIKRQKAVMKKEIKSCSKYLRNEVDKWLSEAPLKDAFKAERKKRITIKDIKKNKREMKYYRIIAIEFIKSISSRVEISEYFLHFHKGIIEKYFLIHIRESFFDINLPACLFDNSSNQLYLYKLPKKNFKKILLRKRTIDSRKMNMISNEDNNENKKKLRRLSTIKQIRKEPILNSIIPPLNEKEKESIVYYYFLDTNLDSHNDNSPRYNFTNFFKKIINDEKFKTYKKNSIKTNILSVKGNNDSVKKEKKSFLKKNFFSRNEIKRSAYQYEILKKKKSLLEYHLLFDPKLIGYNHMVDDSENIFELNTEITPTNKKKLKDMQKFKNKQLSSLLLSLGGLKTDKNIYIMKTLDLKNQYNHKNKGNVNSLISSIKDCNFDSFIKFYRDCNCGPNAFDKDGNSLLTLATKSACLEIVNFLLDEKADPNLQNVSKFIF